MNDPETPDILFINRLAGVAVLDDNNVVPVTNWFDTLGDECTPDKAVSCVAGHDSVGWYAVDLSQFGYAVVH